MPQQRCLISYCWCRPGHQGWPELAYTKRRCSIRSPSTRYWKISSMCSPGSSHSPTKRSRPFRRCGIILDVAASLLYSANDEQMSPEASTQLLAGSFSLRSALIVELRMKVYKYGRLHSMFHTEGM